ARQAGGKVAMWESAWESRWLPPLFGEKPDVRNRVGLFVFRRRASGSRLTRFPTLTIGGNRRASRGAASSKKSRYVGNGHGRVGRCRHASTQKARCEKSHRASGFRVTL